MKYHEGNILCLEYSEFVDLYGIEQYKSDKKRERITIYGHGGNGRNILVDYDKMPPSHKKKFVEKYGDPRKHIAQQPIIDLIQTDAKAEQFYRDFELPNGLKLPDQDRDVNGKPQKNYVHAYTTAASWLNTIAFLTTDKKALKRSLNISVGEFWGTVCDLVKVQNVDLPSTEKRLKEKLKAYYSTKGVNYESLIEIWRFGNGFSKKVDDEVAISLLVEMLSHGHQFDYTVLAKKYNSWAKSVGKEPITPQAVAYWAKKYAHEIEQFTLGKGKWYTKYVKQIHRDRVSCPLGLVGSDDNVLDLYFKKTTVKDGKKQVNYYYRPVLYVIMDTYNDYILGYAFGDTVTIDLIRAAYLNAIHHIKQITGEFYLPHQLQMDRWGLDPKLKGTLAEFYKSIAITTPATARVAPGKWIERAFGVEWHQTLKDLPNYAGHNIGAKERLAPEVIELAKKDYPDYSEAPIYIEAFINALRKERFNEYLTAFNESDKSKERLLTAEKRLATFGYMHVDKHGKVATNTITSGGLTPTIEGKAMVYDVPDQFYPYQVGKKVEIYYDPYDLSSVLATDGKGLRFVADKYKNMPAALIDYQTGDGKRFNNLLEGKKRISAVPGEGKTKRKEILERAGIDTQSFLQSGSLIKEIRQLAERSVQHQLTELTEETEAVVINISEPVKVKSRIGRY